MVVQHFPESTQPLVVSFIGIRRAVGLSGLFLPVLLGPIGWLLFGIGIQDNMSSYYHTPLRDAFVGTLCAMGIFLFCYRGNDWVEDWTANLGCASALGVAFFPMDVKSEPLWQISVIGYLHLLSGAVFFMTLALYSLYHFPSSKRTNAEAEPHERQRDLIYRGSGLVILLSTLAMALYLFAIHGEWKRFCDRYNALFWLETIALWAFAAAWLTKGRTILADIAVDLLAIAQEELIERAIRSQRR